MDKKSIDRDYEIFCKLNQPKEEITLVSPAPMYFLTYSIQKSLHKVRSFDNLCKLRIDRYRTCRSGRCENFFQKKIFFFVTKFFFGGFLIQDFINHLQTA